MKKRNDISWNGMSFSVPGEWTPVGIAKTRLLFEKKHQRAMEIKWFRKAKLSLQSSFEQLTTNFATLSSPPTPINTPIEWQPLLSAYDIQAFSWQGSETQAIGLVLHCSHCQTTTLIQFFSESNTSTIDSGKEVLSSFKDHNCDNYWSLFDFKFQLPNAYKIQSFSLQAGRFELHFSANKSTLSLYRFAIAHEILKTKTVKDVGIDFFEVPESSIFIANNDGHSEWYSEKHGFYSKLAAKMTRKPIATWGKLWHDEFNDKLLAVQAAGNALDHQELTNISKTFYVI